MDKLKTINKALDKYLPKKGKLAKAMRYSIFAGGKRFRPLLCLETAKLINLPEEKALPFACAVEMIHTFTLIHDDLPAMDNSDLRRGKPSCHKAFGEALAILAGDALNTLAFKLISNHPKAVYALAETLLEVVEGQVEDVESSSNEQDLKTLYRIHKWKTAALLVACVKGICLIKGCSQKQQKALEKYATHLGLAFQIADDILDVSSTAEVLGKPSGADINKGFPGLIGLEKSKKLAEEEARKAISALKIFGKKGSRLIEIAESAVKRKK